MAKDSLDGFVIASLSRTDSDYAQAIARAAGQKAYLNEVIDPTKFGEGEFRPLFRADLKGKNVYLVLQPSQFRFATDMLGRLAVAAYSAKERGAAKVIAVCPSLYFARQDRMQEEINNNPKMQFEAVAAEAMANLMRAQGVDMVLTMHMHSLRLYNIFGKIYGQHKSGEEVSSEKLAFEGRKVLFDINPAPLVAYHLMNDKNPVTGTNSIMHNLSLVSTDANSRRTVDSIAGLIKLSGRFPELVHVKFDKIRNNPNDEEAVIVEIANIDELTKLGYSFDDKNLLMIDDMIDTGGTQFKIRKWIYVDSKAAYNLGTPRGISSYNTHSVMAGAGFNTVQKNILKKLKPIEFITTDTRPFITEPNAVDFDFMDILSVLRTPALIGYAIVNCCEKNIHPDDAFKFDSYEALKAFIEDNKLHSVARFDKFSPKY